MKTHDSKLYITHDCKANSV